MRSHQGHRWYRVGPAIVAVPLKNGSTSFRHVVSGGESYATKTVHGFDRLIRTSNRGPYTPGQASRQAERHGLDMVLAVRDPVERFMSLWRSLKSVARSGKTTVLTAEYGLKDPTPGELMDAIEAHPDDNHHWHRQADYLPAGGGAELVDYRELLPRLGFDTALRLNETDLRFIEPPPYSRIRAFFAADDELWRLLRGRFAS